MPDLRESEFDRQFSALYCRYSAFVRYVLIRHGIPQANLDDVAQEVFLTVLKKLPDFEQRSDIKTWIFAICRNKAHQERRRAYNRYEQPVAELESPSIGAEPDAELLERALGSLSEVQRQAFVRRMIDGESVAEIANGLGCSAFTIYTRLSVAARKIQTFVEKRWGAAAWLFPLGRTGERSPQTSKVSQASRVHGYSPLLDAALPLLAATFVVMTPAPNATSSARAPSHAAVVPAMAFEPPGVVIAPAPAQSNATLSPSASAPSPDRPSRARARHKPVARAARVDAAAEIALEAPPLPSPEPEREQEILWHSRLALDTNPDRALALVEEHAAAHRNGLLTEEREVLAIEALLRLRHPSTALERAERFAAAYPDSPYAGPVRQLIERLSFSTRRQAVADSR